MDYCHYRKLFEKRRRHLAAGYHCAEPYLNLQDFDFVNSGDFQVEIPCSAGLGFKFEHYGVLKVGEEPSDLAAQLIMKKREWCEKLKAVTPKEMRRKSCKCLAASLQHLSRVPEVGSRERFNNVFLCTALRDLKRFRDGFDQKISVNLRRYVEHMRFDPLPGFEGDRNWLYTGGTITSISDDTAGSGVSLISCSGPGLSTVCTYNQFLFYYSEHVGFQIILTIFLS